MNKEKEVEDLLQSALENLETVAHAKGLWTQPEPGRVPGSGRGRVDGVLELTLDAHQIKLYAEVKKELRNHHLPQLLTLAKQYQPFMVIAGKIFPKLKAELRENGIAYLEANGNAWIRRNGLLIWVDHQQPAGTGKVKTVPERPNRAFTKTGLKVVFHFLLDETSLHLSYREIAARSGVALGQVNYVFNGLRERGFLVKFNQNEYRLTNKRALLDRWLEAYEERLKPSLAMGRFRFLKAEDFDNWRNIALKNAKSRWGGEAAGDLYTNYLKPATLTVYTLETKTELMSNYRLVPDANGFVEAYEKFWSDDEVNTNVVPPLLAYTDLINTNDKRCQDTAQLIYDAFKDRFE
ncbi:MAG: hypothetical protein AVDCRST_MAG56-3132 [uncultured Cytophagales bacterium]|uniref:Uncharacterized protein n=1 Tax=uncultured Cytophagales bacterium TaxID=158755 RepID=A0A6J4JAH9_9SPHI|nr:MAG: hypothetical protein AVDCRST_MAG56-3132 [uncultured Cytophagales bacterium]